MTTKSRVSRAQREALRPVVRPLRDIEARLLRWGVIRERRRFVELTPLITLAVGLVIFGALWGFSILATKADGKGPSWKMSGLIWLAIGIPISLWAHRDIRKHAATQEGACASALQRNQALEIRIAADQVIAIQRGEKLPEVYAFQIAEETVVILHGQARWRRKLPNSDFSLIDLFTRQGRSAAGLVEIYGKRLDPMRTINAQDAGGLAIPEHLALVSGRLEQLETHISRSSG